MNETSATTRAESRFGCCTGVLVVGFDAKRSGGAAGAGAEPTRAGDHSLSHPPAIFRPMDLGPVIRIIENVPAALPAERDPAPARPEPAKEPTPA